MKRRIDKTAEGARLLEVAPMISPEHEAGYLAHADAFDLLVVEDDPRDAELTMLGLKQTALPVRAHAVRDGAEALDCLFGGPSSGHRQTTVGLKLVLLDLKLPKIGGLEVLRRIRSNDATRNIPIVVLSSSSEERDIAESYALGANSYLVKPCRFDQFIERLSAAGRYWLEHNQPPR